MAGRGNICNTTAIRTSRNFRRRQKLRNWAYGRPPTLQPSNPPMPPMPPMPPWEYRALGRSQSSAPATALAAIETTRATEFSSKAKPSGANIGTTPMEFTITKDVDGILAKPLIEKRNHYHGWMIRFRVSRNSSESMHQEGERSVNWKSAQKTMMRTLDLDWIEVYWESERKSAN